MMREFVKKYRYEILVFFIVFLPRLAYSIFVYAHSGSHGFISYLDAEVFVREAENILEHGVMSQFPVPPFLPDPLRTPLYLWFLAGFLWLHAPLFAIVSVQNLLAAASGVLIYRIAKTQFAAPRVGIIAAALFAVEPMTIYWNNLLMSDGLFAFLFLATVHVSLHRRWFWGAALLGLATLARPVGLYFLPLFLLWAVFCHFPLSSLNVRPLLAKLFLMLAIFAALIFPWMLRNKIIFDRFELATAGWLNLYLFTMTEFAASKGETLPMPVVPEAYHPDAAAGRVLYNYEFASADFYKEHSKKLVSRYPVDYLLFHLGSGVRSMNNHDYYYLVDYVLTPEVPSAPLSAARALARFGQLAWLALYFFAAVGVFRGVNAPVKIFLLALFIFNNLLIGYNGVITSGGRYNLAFVPLLLLLGTYGFIESYRWVRGKITNYKSQIPNNIQ